MASVNGDADIDYSGLPRCSYKERMYTVTSFKSFKGKVRRFFGRLRLPTINMHPIDRVMAAIGNVDL